MPLSIPSSHRAIIGKISRQSPKERSALLRALEQIRLTSLSLGRLATDLSESSDLSHEESEDLLSVIANLHVLPLVGSIKRSEVVPEVLRTVEGDKKIGADKSQLDDTGKFFNKALEFEAFKIFSKALQLYTGYERLLAKAKIFTDIRPIFENGVDEPAALILSHTLKLTVYRGQERRAEEIFVTFDKNDLEMLAEVVRRARAKQESLERFSTAAGIEILAPEEQ